MLCLGWVVVEMGLGCDKSLTLKLKFDFVDFLSESLKFTLKITFVVDVEV